MTYTNALSTAEQVKNLIDKSKDLTIDKVSKQIGVSRTKLSQYLNGTYPSDTTDLEKALGEFLEEQKSLEEASKVDRAFFESKDARQIIAICQSCHQTQGLGVLIGNSGYGKTHTLRRYAELPKVAYVEADDSMGVRDLVDAIESAVGLPSMYGSIYKRTNRIKDFFNVNTGYLLIVDEADKLISKYTVKKMEVLRTIFDQSSAAVLVAGEPVLESMLRGYDARFANRIDFFVALKGLSREEVIEYLSDLDIDKRATEELVVRATNPQSGCFRLFNRTLRNVFRLVKEDERITYKQISEASAMMLL